MGVEERGIDWPLERLTIWPAPAGIKEEEVGGAVGVVEVEGGGGTNAFTWGAGGDPAAAVALAVCQGYVF